MRFIKQKLKFKVDAVDNASGSNRKRHGHLLPDSIRCLIVGPSNCGKTNLMICLLENENGLRYRNIYVYSKSLQQPKYEYLKKLMGQVSGIGYFPFAENQEVIAPHDARPDSIFIFDDIACENMNAVRRYFSMGRHARVDSFFLCQSYTRVPKHLVRDNANLLFVFQQDALNLKHIFDDHVGSDMNFSTFHRLCRSCWGKEVFGHLIIDKDSPINTGRYRCGLDTYIHLDPDD